MATTKTTVLVAVAAMLLLAWLAWRRRDGFRPTATGAAPPTPVSAKGSVPAMPSTDGYDCSQAWATCPSGPPYCYWGDKDYNKGRCCAAPWSGPDGCRDPLALVPRPPTAVASARALAVYNTTLASLAAASSPEDEDA